MGKKTAGKKKKAMFSHGRYWRTRIVRIWPVARSVAGISILTVFRTRALSGGADGHRVSTSIFDYNRATGKIILPLNRSCIISHTCIRRLLSCLMDSSSTFGRHISRRLVQWIENRCSRRLFITIDHVFCLAMAILDVPVEMLLGI